jgi:hypothetical protein
VDLSRVWTAVAAEVWRRPAGRAERAATWLLRSPGLARALVTTPSLLLPWLISTVVVFGVGALVRLGPGQPAVWLVAPAIAGVGIAFAYGPGIDPAWELSSSCAVSDRLVLLTRAVTVFALNAVLGLVASAASGAVAALTFGWLLPMAAVSALALAVAVAARSAIVGAGAGVAASRSRSRARMLTFPISSSRSAVPRLLFTQYARKGDSSECEPDRDPPFVREKQGS